MDDEKARLMAYVSRLETNQDGKPIPLDFDINSEQSEARADQLKSFYCTSRKDHGAAMVSAKECRKAAVAARFKYGCAMKMLDVYRKREDAHKTEHERRVKLLKDKLAQSNTKIAGLEKLDPTTKDSQQILTVTGQENPILDLEERWTILQKRRQALDSRKKAKLC